jgi:hypothetical protein
MKTLVSDAQWRQWGRETASKYGLREANADQFDAGQPSMADWLLANRQCIEDRDPNNS